jgi:protein-S-isoprenylcysteine O-methyltransferase Ste14
LDGDPAHGRRVVVRVAGLAVALAGLVLTARSAQLLAGRGRPQRGPQPAFVLAGPYLRVRNPLFAGVVLALGGAALVGGSWLLGTLAAMVLVVAHVWVVRVEEPALRARFGLAYVEYLRSVPRWLPRWSR